MPDIEDLYEANKELVKKLELVERERDQLKVKLATIETKSKEREKAKDKMIAQTLRDLLDMGQKRQPEQAPELPKHTMRFLEHCVKSDSERKIEDLEKQLKRKDEEIHALNERLISGDKDAPENANANVGDVSRGQPERTKVSKPWELDVDDTSRSLDSPASSRQSTGRRTILSGKPGDSALQAARAEIERLQKLYNAGETVRDSLTKQVEDLQKELRKLQPDPGAPASEHGSAASAAGEEPAVEQHDKIFTQDNRAFENYIRKLAGLPELPSSEKTDRASQRVRVSTGPKTSAHHGGKVSPSVPGKKSDEWAVYEVITCSFRFGMARPAMSGRVIILPSL
jgi:chaperonin cofactor prefoldin